LHVAPGKRTTLDRQLNQSQIADDFIECGNVSQICSLFVSVLNKAVEVKITHKQP
jgi:hypothetical protein